MGLGAGGRMKQRFIRTLGMDTWDPNNRASVFVHLVNSELYRELTGVSPASASLRAELFRSWPAVVDLYDEALADVMAPESLTGIKLFQFGSGKEGYRARGCVSSLMTIRLRD